MADMVGRSNVQTHFLSGAQHAGMFVYTSRCKELGVVPASRVLEAMATVRVPVKPSLLLLHPLMLHPLALDAATFHPVYLR